MKKAAQRDAEYAWKVLVSLVMETRGDWRRKVIEVTGLPFSRARALWRLEREPRTLAQLAHEMSTDAPAATMIVNDLESRGLVTRSPHPQSRRTKLVALTLAGRKMLAAVEKISDRPPPTLLQLPEQDLAELRRIVEAVSGEF
jgi:DNA-binding MarR family transcriptional regulator